MSEKPVIGDTLSELDHDPHPSNKNYSFKTIPMEYRDCEMWPAANLPSSSDLRRAFPKLSTVEAETRALEISKRFHRLARGIKEYLATGNLKNALAEANCAKKTFYVQLNRCLSPHTQTPTEIMGWAGIISHLRINHYNRTKEGIGTAGQFAKWLRVHPDWHRKLDNLILRGNGGDKISARKPTVRGVAANFIHKLKQEIPQGTYPHTGKDNGRRSIERYIKSFIVSNPKCTAVWFGEQVAKRQHLGTGKQSFNLATAPFDQIHSDTHVLDALGILIINGPGIPVRIPVTRILLVANMCARSKAVTGYAVCIRAQISAAHLEQAYLMGHKPWKPKLLTIKGLAYDRNAGFPNGSVDGIIEINPASIKLDNAVQHYANDIQLHLRKTIGCAISWGGIGEWWTNADLERLFGTLERYGFQRLPSSIGSNPVDMHRSSDPAREATGRGIEFDELIQLIDVIIANYNGRPHSSLGGASPLEVLRLTLDGRRPQWIPRELPPETATSAAIGVDIEKRRIGGYVDRRIPPYVEIDEVRYTSDCLSSRYDLIGCQAYVHIPHDDMRVVKIFLDSGEYLGEVRCMHKGWALSPHSREVRKAINARIRSNELWVPDGGDPIVRYHDHLASKAINKTPHGSASLVTPEASVVADLELSTGLSTNRNSKPERKAANTSSYSRRKSIHGKLPTKWE